MPEIEVVAVQLWSSIDHSPEDNRAHALRMLEAAAATRPDLVVLPEAVAMLCFPDGKPDFSYTDVAESIPGPTSDEACRIAAKYKTNVVIGLIEKRPTGGQNLALVIDRNGKVVGRYEKIHEPEICRREQDALTGDQSPVFDLDFGRIGIFICWDVNYPELTAILAAKHADLLIFPHLIALPQDGNFAITIRSRAIDTGLPIVAAGMRDAHNHNGIQDGLGATCVIDGNGTLLANATDPKSLLLRCTVPLSELQTSRQRVRRFRKDVRPDVYTKEWRDLS